MAITSEEELQAKEFLKRAEIRTMRKDLLALREKDAVKERDKIAKIRTLEEQQAEQKKKLEAQQAARAQEEKTKRETVLQQNAQQEHAAEKNLKEYASEQERQQIFLLESERLSLEKRMDVIDKEKDPQLKLEKNKLLIDQRSWEKKLEPLVTDEKKLENEQKFLVEKAENSTVPAERKSLEQRRWDLDKNVQEIEKKRWEIEKHIEESAKKLSEIGQTSDALMTEKNALRDKILGIDKSLREIYSAVIARTEELRKGKAKEQLAAKAAAEQARSTQRAQVQREQWTGAKPPVQEKPFMKQAPQPLKEKLQQSAQAEEEQRKKFLQDLASMDNNNPGPQQKSPSVTQPPQQTPPQITKQ